MQAIGPELWIHDGAPVRFLGIPYPTRMAVARLAGGDLWVWSPTALVPPLVDELEALGRVHHLVAPNKLHHLFLAPWAERWPQARLWAAPGLARRRRDLRFHGELTDEPPAAWADAIDQVVFGGSLFMDEVVFFHRASRTVLVADLIQKFDPATLAGWRLCLMRLDGLVGPKGSTPREWRLTFVRRSRARAALRRALDWNPERLMIAHGRWVEEGGRDELARSLAWLGGG